MRRQKSIATLKAEASRATSWRRHLMAWGKSFRHNNGVGRMATCKYCNCVVQVLTQPKSHETAIAGDALEVTCTGWGSDERGNKSAKRK